MINGPAPTKATACGMPWDAILSHMEPLIFEAASSDQHDRVRITMSIRDFLVFLDGLNRLLQMHDVDAGSDPEHLGHVRELEGQCWAFWQALQGSVPTHACVSTRALRSSNRDVFHSDEVPPTA